MTKQGTPIESLGMFSKPILGIAEGCTTKEWKPLKSSWLIQGYDRQEEVEYFLHTLPSKGSAK